MAARMSMWSSTNWKPLATISEADPRDAACTLDKIIIEDKSTSLAYILWTNNSTCSEFRILKRKQAAMQRVMSSSREPSRPLMSLIPLLFLLPSGVKAAQCSVCPGGENITLLEKEIAIPGFDFISDCSDLETFVPVLLQDGSPECQVIRDLGSLCGCPRKKNTCNLCPDGSKVANPDLEVPLIFQDQFQGITPTCELFEAFLHSVDESNSTCTLAQKVLSDYCGCSSSEEQEVNGSPCLLCPGGEAITSPNKTLELEGFPLQNCQELEDAALIFLQTSSGTCGLLQSVGSFCGCPPPIEDGCTLCKDGSRALNQSRPIPVLEEEFGFVPTCDLLEAALRGEHRDSSQCMSSQFFGSWCGCPPVENHCFICDPGDNFTLLDKEIPQFQRFTPFIPTCELIESFQYQVEQSDDMCQMTHDQRWRCGCSNGIYDYLGANTISKQAVLAWIPRATGLLSICGSVYILYDILSQRKKKLDKTYPQLMVAIAIFDIVNSTAWALSTLPIPAYDEYGETTNIYGAKGNEATCTAQGFFIQLGYTGIFYNLTLSLYYYLVIVLGWKETRLKKFRKWLHIVPLVFGFSLAFAGIPHYDIHVLACYIPPPPIVDTWTNIVVFALAPISFVILFLTVVMSIVYLKVRKNSRASNKWRTGHPNDNDGQRQKKQSLENEVFWQCVFYVCSFYVSWPILIASNAKSGYVNYGFGVVLVILAPIQGFTNCVVYLRPRLLRNVRTRKRARESRTISVESDDSSPSRSSLLRGAVTGVVASTRDLWAKLRQTKRKQKSSLESRRRPAEYSEEDYIEPEIAIAADAVDEDGHDVNDSGISSLPQATVSNELHSSQSVPGFNMIDRESSIASENSLTLDDLVAQPVTTRRHSCD